MTFRLLAEGVTAVVGTAPRPPVAGATVLERITWVGVTGWAAFCVGAGFAGVAFAGAAFAGAAGFAVLGLTCDGFCATPSVTSATAAISATKVVRTFKN
jgi:hypothetical protein